MIDHLFEAAPIGLGVLDRDLRWVRVNSALAALQRRTPEELLGRCPSEIHPEVGPRVEAVAREVLETGRTLRRRMDGVVAARSNTTAGGTSPGSPSRRAWAWRRWRSPTAYGPSTSSPRRTGATRSWRAASHLLSSALTVQEAAELVAKLAVPELADWCFVELVREGGIQRVGGAAPRPGEGAVHRRVRPRVPARPGVAGRLAEGHPHRRGRAHPRDPRRVPAAGRARRGAPAPPARGRVQVGVHRAAHRPRPDPRRPGAGDRRRVGRGVRPRHARRRPRPGRPLRARAGQRGALRPARAGRGDAAGGAAAAAPAARSPASTSPRGTRRRGRATRSAATSTTCSRRTPAGRSSSATWSARARRRRPSPAWRATRCAPRRRTRARRASCCGCSTTRCWPSAPATGSRRWRACGSTPRRDGARLTVSVAGPSAAARRRRRRDASARSGASASCSASRRTSWSSTPATTSARASCSILYTDGVTEARGPGGMFGEDHLRSLLMTLGGEAPTRVLQRVESAVLAASGGRPRDDLALSQLPSGSRTLGP